MPPILPALAPKRGDTDIGTLQGRPRLCERSRLLNSCLGGSASNGVASVELPATGGAKYVVQLLDVGVGPVSVWSATTPDVSR